ncbi:biotin-dependent carboxyltransferase family protein [Candidatus Villigracilis saccharophilus]|uniref:5-oxoprolinase subunit C family protein n=1 Tax=Candidatus Villigracilis saccharophilus TaxID=3140684 RepID=UPI0031373B26|nr:biotin-dependent carboxyltransferase family protein [Anaerolineales bacterium]
MLEVLDVSGLVTFQDSGRHGFASYGVPTSGSMDWFAYQAANSLVGNSVNATVIEIGLGEAVFRAKRNCILAVTGAGFEVLNYVWTFPLWTSFFVRAGWVVHVKKTSGGNWAYLAAAGGFEVETVLNSSSTYLRGGLGDSIHAGDILQTGKPSNELLKLAARNFPVEKYMAYSQSPVIEVIPGPQKERFTEEGLLTFLNSEYTLSASFDRMGYRLDGSPIQHSAGADLISEGMMMGSIQVPANGQPIIMMADSPTTGGYPKIACVVKTSLPLLAQCESGVSKIRFKETTVEEAQNKYRELRTERGLQSAV